MIPVHYSSTYGDLNEDLEEDYPHADELRYQHKQRSRKYRQDRRERRELIKARKETQSNGMPAR